MIDYQTFTEDLLLAIYQVNKTLSDSQFIVASDAFNRLGYKRVEHKKWEALDDLDAGGYINALKELGIGADGRSIMLLGPGIREAERIIDARRPKSILERLKGVPRSDWIALAALILSFIALLK